MAYMRVSNGLLRDYCFAHGWEAPTPGYPFLFGLRNALLWPEDEFAVDVEPSRPDRWDDVLGVGGTEWRLFPATTDPGIPYTKQPMNEKGAAWLVPGTYHFRLGRHKSLFVNALVQNGPVTVRRDRDRDGRPEYGELLERGEFGIYIHSGGSIGKPVGKWSAGCQVVPRPYWVEFWSIVRQQPRWVYTLFDALLLAQWAAERK
jgi:hypothetical protein